MANRLTASRGQDKAVRLRRQNEVLSKENKTGHSYNKKPALSLLKKFDKEPLSSDYDDVDNDPDETIEIEKIVGDRKCEENKIQYKVHWKGYDTDDETWENESDLDSSEIIQLYTTAKQEKTLKKRSRQQRKKLLPTSNKIIKIPDKLLGVHTFENGKREFFIRWKDLSELHDSWVPEEVVIGTEAYNNYVTRKTNMKIKKKLNLAKSLIED